MLRLLASRKVVPGQPWQALKSRLALNASVERDGAWKTVPAA